MVKYLPDAQSIQNKATTNQPKPTKTNQRKTTMKKVYCDRCGKEVEQEYYITLHKKAVGTNVVSAGDEFFDICPDCRESFFGWLGGQPYDQQKPAKTEKPSEKKTTRKHTVAEIAASTNAPESTVRRHLDGLVCPSTYGKDKNGRTIRYYHLTGEQMETIIDRIKNRQQGRRIDL
jgi:hypothetical protein